MHARKALHSAPAGIPVIFTTAYDQYAVQAFKFNSILTGPMSFLSSQLVT